MAADLSPVPLNSEPDTPTPPISQSCLWCQHSLMPKLETLEKDNDLLRLELSKMEDRVNAQELTIQRLNRTTELFGTRLNDFLSGFFRLDKEGIRREAERRAERHNPIREKLFSGAMSVMHPGTHASSSSSPEVGSPDLSSLTHVTPPKSSPPQSLLSPTGSVPVFGLPPAASDEGGTLDAFGPPVIGSPLAVPGKWVGTNHRERERDRDRDRIMIGSGGSGSGGSASGGSGGILSGGAGSIHHSGTSGDIKYSITPLLTILAEASPSRKASPLTSNPLSLSSPPQGLTTITAPTLPTSFAPGTGTGGAIQKVSKEDGEWKCATYAGSQAGWVEGGCRSARFKQPYGLCVDYKGFLYIADRANHRIRKISPSHSVSTLGGSDAQGHTDGPVASAAFHSPVGIAVDTVGNLYVADNDRIRRISAAGVVSTLVDGSSEGAQFHGLVVDNRGTVFFTDKKTHRIFKITPGPKRKISILAGTGYPGYKDGQWDRAYFNSPSGIAVDNISGDIYVADYGNHRIRRISVTRQVVTIAGSGTKADHDGVGINACFNFPSAVVCHPDGVSNPSASASLGAIYVLDESHRLKKIDLYSGEVTSLVGTGSAGYRDVGSASFNYPRGLAMDRNGTIWISDTYNHRIRKVMYWSTIDGDVL